MNVVVLTPIRIFGDGLASCLSSRPEVNGVVIVNDLAALRSTLTKNETDVALIDVTQGVDLIDVRAIALQWPGVPLVALGLHEERHEVIKCGRGGFAGYVARGATVEVLCTALSDIVEGRVACPPEIAGSLMRALFRKGPQSEEPHSDPALTRREAEVLELVGRGFSNKEIAKELCLSVATVKHHVHHILEKLGLSRRAEAMRRVRDAPWLVRMSAIEKSLNRKMRDDEE
jgi:two-component system, NarL family, nitrate/nitrite response regulator NarL